MFTWKRRVLVFHLKELPLMTYVSSSFLVQKIRKLSTSASKANMAEPSAKIAKMARNLAMAHIVIGFLLICFGIGDRLVEFHKFCSWTGRAYFGIWIGIWVSTLKYLPLVK